MSGFIYLTGQRFGRLEVLERRPRIEGERVKWLCQCDCGNSKVATTRDLRNGDTASCGCLKGETNQHLPFKHGHATNGLSPEYSAWRAMRKRCSEPNNVGYKHYGGRGVKVCERWNTFESFLADMGPKPSAQHSLDRYPNYNGNYEPGNCRWATKKEQQRNTRRTIRLIHNGVEMSLAEYAEITGIKYKTALQRVHLAVPLADAVLLTKPKYTIKRKKPAAPPQESRP